MTDRVVATSIGGKHGLPERRSIKADPVAIDQPALASMRRASSIDSLPISSPSSMRASSATRSSSESMRTALRLPALPIDLLT